MANGKDALLRVSDAQDIGFMIVEMADRARTMHKVIPGAQAKWAFEMDGVRYIVTVDVDDAAKPQA